MKEFIIRNLTKILNGMEEFVDEERKYRKTRKRARLETQATPRRTRKKAVNKKASRKTTKSA